MTTDGMMPMWQPFSDFVMTYVDPVGVVVGLLIAVPVFWTWYEVAVGQRRQRRRLYRALRRDPGGRPGMFVLDLLPGKDVRPAVERFRQTDAVLRSIPPERLFCLTRDRALTPEDLPRLHEDLRKLAARIVAEGVDVLHFFHAGPAVAAALVGCEFANGCRVMLYQHDHGDYVNFGTLKTL
jgi:hypothetical protein